MWLRGCLSSFVVVNAILSAAGLGLIPITPSFARADELSSQDSTLAVGLVGHWKLRGDCRDYSGKGNHGHNHGVDLTDGSFDGRSAYIEVPQSESLRLGAGDFTISARVWTAEQMDDIVGDVFDLYDPERRRGITLSINASAGGYQGPGDDRHVYFGIDNARVSDWEDCGRPNPTSNYVSNSLTTFDGHLYAGTTEAADKEGWCHVYRYEGGREWTDCGRVGDRKTTGVMPLIVHKGQLYAVTSTYDWTRVRKGDFEPGRVYRYLGGTRWEELGQPSVNRTLNCLGSFQGRLFVGGGPQAWGVFEYQGGGEWKPSIMFPMDGPGRCFPHPMYRHNGRLFVAFPGAYAFDGERWEFAGITSATEETLQTHSFTVHQGKLCAGTWPEGMVSQYDGGTSWHDIGRVGVDGTEVNALIVYNGKLYGGSIPRAEVCRYDGAEQWTSLKRFYSPEGWTPVPPADVGGNPTSADLNEWSRVTSLTIHRGRLFAGIGSCTSSIQDAPADVRGRVFSLEAGKCASFDGDIGPGWRHLAAARQGGELRLYVDGKLVARSTSFDPGEYDVSADAPLKIGFGQTDYFCGKIADFRLYNRCLSASEAEQLAAVR